ncbi:hypothetical protein [uncultured Maricaulis sp.]|uniref:hypothetical protein n=1 Tax=uncultured Maricaulis sp. TaxID=174710 RepID=UPI0030D8CB84|tara:strand:+ start:5229 stop:6137 length:909 start_codon:yes stop_codon:yes gene_type:complete
MDGITHSDAVLWYNVGVFGEMGYGIPNPSDDYGTINPTIAQFVSGAGSQLFTIMHHEDARQRRPPTLNTIMRIHRLYQSSSRMLAGRMVPSNELNMESQHIQVGGEIFRVFPVPYFMVRNSYMRRWAGFAMMMISEAMQHTENARSMEVSDNFVGLMGQYLRRIYTEMAIELFGKTREEALDPIFSLQDSDFQSYNPHDAFPGTEFVDTVPPLNRVMTEDQLGVLRDGIPVSELPQLSEWPVNLRAVYDRLRPDGTTPEAEDLAAGGTPGQTGTMPTGAASRFTQGTGAAATSVPLPPSPLP